MPTRIVNGVIRLPTGDPWPSFQVNFTLTPSAQNALEQQTGKDVVPK